MRRFSLLSFTKAYRLLAEYWRRKFLTLKYPSIDVPDDIVLGMSSRISVSDGGTAEFGAGCSFEGFSTVIVKFGRLSIEEGTFVGVGSYICARDQISIGRNCLIAEYVTIRDQDHVFGPGIVTCESGFVTDPIEIGENVWIGAKCTITKGVSIGSNSVVGANSVVTTDIPANAVAAGAPARVIRRLDEPLNGDLGP